MGICTTQDFGIPSSLWHSNILHSTCFDHCACFISQYLLRSHRDKICCLLCLQDLFQWDGNPGGALIAGLHSPVPINGDIHQALGAQANDFLQPLMDASDFSEEALCQALLPGEQGPSMQQ